MSELPEGAPLESDSPAPLGRLDPDRAASDARSGGQPPQPPAAIDTRPYKWMIGIFGILLVIAASVYQFARNGVGTPGVTPGKRLHFFVAPLASGNLKLDSNAHPRCDPAHPNPKGLNICGRRPTVLAFFTTSSGTCEREVDALQALAGKFEGVQFGAVAVRSSGASTAAAARAHHWTIPVAYDRDGALGALYGVEICPMVELAYRGGKVANRLIGERWTKAAALAPQVRVLIGKDGRG